MRVVLAGNPNVGKTSLFNGLSGSRHRVGNYSGVTIERREFDLKAGDRKVTVVDLPGTYSLTPLADDERIAYQEIRGQMGRTPDLVLVVVDASNLARNLYFVHQIAELCVPYAVVLNMVDVARERGQMVDPEQLSSALGVPVVCTCAHRSEGLKETRELLATVDLAPLAESKNVWGRRPLPLSSPAVEECLEALGDRGLPDATVAGPAYAWICAAAAHSKPLDPDSPSLHALGQTTLEAACSAIIEARYAQVDALLQRLTKPAQTERQSRSDRIDEVLTHAVWGPCVFLLVMGALFEAMYMGADPLMGAIESAVAWAQDGVLALLGPGMLSELLREGVVAGVGNVLVFVPQISLLFLGIGLLEDSGYMARAAFLADRVMSKVGLNGRSFLPLLSGYACAIPAILGTRTLSRFRVRLVTMLMVPYTSCSARLPIYLLLLGAFFPEDQKLGGLVSWGSLILLGIYVCSLVSALVVGLLLRKTVLRGPTPTLVLELPPYRRPRLRNVLREVWDRVMDFCRDAGTVILCFTVILWGLLSFPRVEVDQNPDAPAPIEQSYGGRFGRMLEPALVPMGQDWRVGVGIVGSFAAREVFVSTLGTVYGIEDSESEDSGLKDQLLEAKDPATGKFRYSPLSALALIVFFIYSAQCMSTLAVLKRETRSWRWPIFSFVSMTLIAYLASVALYQGGLLIWPDALR